MFTTARRQHQHRLLSRPQAIRWLVVVGAFAVEEGNQDTAARSLPDREGNHYGEEVEVGSTDSTAVLAVPAAHPALDPPVRGPAVGSWSKGIAMEAEGGQVAVADPQGVTGLRDTHREGTYAVGEADEAWDTQEPGRSQGGRHMVRNVGEVQRLD